MNDLSDSKKKKRAQWAWYLYDFGNSAYAAVVLLAVYASYFKQGVVGTAQGSALWGYSLTISMLVVAVISPFLGALADYSGKKKTLLLIMTSISIIFTALLFFVQKGDIALGMILFIIAEIGYRAGQVFYNSLLVDVADEDEIGKVSGNGWAIGSLGGIICLVIVLALIQLNPNENFIIRPISGHYGSLLRDFYPANHPFYQGISPPPEKRRQEFVQGCDRTLEKDHPIRQGFQGIPEIHGCRPDL